MLVPKIIENLSQKILVVASDLFQQRGFQDTDMRQIAAHTGIAVGTLYRYFSDKEDLYINVLVNTWKQTRGKLERIANQTQAPKERFYQMVATLIKDLQTNHRLDHVWREVARMHLEQPAEIGKAHKFENMHTSFATLFGQVLAEMTRVELDDTDHNQLNQLGSYAFIMAVNACIHPPEEIGPQAELITELFSAYTTQCNRMGAFFTPTR